jgi:heat shock protein HslJ
MLKIMPSLSLILSLGACAQTGSVAPVISSDLQAHAWHLVEIASMDDTVYRPANNTHYSLTFMPAGNVAVVADCNRGRGTWQSAQVGR